MMGRARARASGETQAMAVAVFFFKNLAYFDLLCASVEIERCGPQIRTKPRD